MTHPLDMSLSITGWSIEPELLDDIRLELVHSQQTGDYFLIKMEFKNGTKAVLEIEMEDGSVFDTYEALTNAIRVPRKAPVIENDNAAEV